MHHSYLFHKPYDVLSQFTQEHPGQRTLAEFLDVEKDVYPVGRLDRDSEGLLLLSNDKKLINSILHPSNKKYKTYLVQVEGAIKESDVEVLKSGIPLRINKKNFTTQPALVQVLEDPPKVNDRKPAIRVRKNIPTSWVEIKISEGKKRQVRKMFAAIGFPVLRLIRTHIGPYALGDLKPGEVVKI